MEIPIGNTEDESRPAADVQNRFIPGSRASLCRILCTRARFESFRNGCLELAFGWRVPRETFGLRREFPALNLSMTSRLLKLCCSLLKFPNHFPKGCGSYLLGMMPLQVIPPVLAHLPAFFTVRDHAP